MIGSEPFILRAIVAVAVCCLMPFVGAQVTDPSEVSALQAIRSSLFDPKNNLRNWNRGDPCTSNWIGVLCFNKTSNDGYLHVRELQLLNMNLTGSLAPELGQLSYLEILDVMWNKISGSIPKEIGNIKSLKLLDLSHNRLNGSIPSNFSGLPFLQKLSLANNSLSGSVPSSVWQNATLNGNRSLILDFENNMLTNISDVVSPPANVTIMLQGNPFCRNSNPSLVRFCGSIGQQVPLVQTNSSSLCHPQSCPATAGYEYVPEAPSPCTCAAPIRVGYRLKSPGFSNFPPYREPFEVYLSSGLNLNLYQLSLDSVLWEEGPRLRMYLKFFPANKSTFNISEILQISHMFTGWNIRDSDIFGPYELLNFTLLGPYTDVIVETHKSGINKGVLAGIILGTVAVSVILTALISVFIMRQRYTYQSAASKRRQSSKIQLKIDGVKCFTFGEMASATNNFNNSSQVGQGGYGKVYKGILADGTVVAVKRAQEGSLQGSKEFCTEIELLSRLHHRNLVSLVGYCDEEDEQMLVYEFMPNGTLRDHLSGKAREPLSFSMRLRIALGSARGILYLHAEADPPIFHRDIKSSNILLDSKFVAKVADFGLSRLAPVSDTDGTIPGHVSTVVKGTPGYLDPEYFLTHKLTDRSDVYSLGVVFLELLTGMHPISHGKNIVREVNAAYESGMTFSMIDGRMGTYPSECIEKFIALALRCCLDETDARPSMAEVVKVLDNLCRMTPEADATPSESMSTSSKSVTPPSSSLSSGGPYFSTDVSGSDLLSEAPPNVTPR